MYCVHYCLEINSTLKEKAEILIEDLAEFPVCKYITADNKVTEIL